MQQTGEVGTQNDLEAMITEQLGSGKSRMEVVGELKHMCHIQRRKPWSVLSKHP